MQHIEARIHPKAGILLATGLPKGRKGSGSSSQAAQMSLKGATCSRSRSRSSANSGREMLEHV